MVYNSVMPINERKSHRVQVTVTIDEWYRILDAVNNAKKSGYKMTASKYITGVLRSHWENESIFREASK